MSNTMEFLNLQACSLGQLHPVWLGLHNPLSILNATSRAQLLIKRYPLSTSHSAGSNKKDVCPHSKQKTETTTYFLIHSCPSRPDDPTLKESWMVCCSLMVLVDPETLTYYILDSTHTDTSPYNEELYRNFDFTDAPISTVGGWYKKYTSKPTRIYTQ